MTYVIPWGKKEALHFYSLSFPHFPLFWSALAAACNSVSFMFAIKFDKIRFDVWINCRAYLFGSTLLPLLFTFEGLWCQISVSCSSLTMLLLLMLSITMQTSKHRGIMVLLRDLVLSFLRHNIFFQARHIPVLINSSADYISRSQVEKFKAILPELGKTTSYRGVGC